ncbi:MAG: hypothetical protein BGN91_08290 [Nitrobacter sp. 62-13]|jgi:hypothetical protein|uniref:ion channel n=1 Tax=Nitrobacter sp. 62-13 TaxID=1895797 RepID=UPI00095FC1C6|nr:ion channel [Nitrobacter sp. 62-13]OJU23808.1 MAG: hypothetical protein BGN91_08290 [Nitrobacter sp. 62-13]
MFKALALATFMVAACIVIHYETLRYMSVLIPSLKVAVRLKVLLVVFGCFIAHTIEVWLYAFAYLLLDQIGFGSLKGHTEEHFVDFLYFSATSYSTLGIGDVYPTGVFRLISGLESINGLFLIAWSTSFTYFVMDRLWPLHSDRTNEDRSD